MWFEDHKVALRSLPGGLSLEKTNKQTKTSEVGFHSKFSLMAEFEETLKLFCPSLVLL